MSDLNILLLGNTKVEKTDLLKLLVGKGDKLASDDISTEENYVYEGQSICITAFSINTKSSLAIFNVIISIYLKSTNAVLIAVDVTKTIDEQKQQIEDFLNLKNINSNNPLFFIILTKTDLTGNPDEFEQCRIDLSDYIETKKSDFNLRVLDATTAETAKEVLKTVCAELPFKTQEEYFSNSCCGFFTPPTINWGAIANEWGAIANEVFELIWYITKSIDEECYKLHKLFITANAFLMPESNINIESLRKPCKV